MSKRIAKLAGVAAVLFAVTAFAQTPQQVSQCREQNNKSFGELVSIIQKEESAGNIPKPELSNLSRHLDRITESLNKSGQTMTECQATGRYMDNLRSEVQRITGPVVQCRAQNQKARLELVQMFQNARSAGNISPDEAQSYESLEQRLNAMAENLNRDGLTLPECRQFSYEINSVRSNVQRMAATPASPGADPQLAQCRAQNSREHGEAAQLLQRAIAGNNIRSDQANVFSRNLNSIAGNLNKNNLTLPECQQITRDIANIRSSISQMAPTSGQEMSLPQCRADNWKAHNEASNFMQQARSAGKIGQPQGQAFAEMNNRLAGIGQNLNRGNLTLPECQRITHDIADVRSDALNLSMVSDPQLAQCYTQNQKDHSALVQLIQQAHRAGKLKPQDYADMDRRLAGIGQALNSGYLRLPQCQQAITRDIANIRSGLQMRGIH
ncbi:MAG: hypothetical protein K4571_00685 [Deltaproteobacteria bacterium]